MGKVGRHCSVCAHKARHQIDVGLTHCVPVRALAARFELSKDALHRHAANHLSPVQRAAILAAQKPSAIDLTALQASESEGLLSQLITQRARLQAHSELAADMGDIRGAVAAEAGITANLSLVTKLLGLITTHHDVRTTSILVSPDYLRLRDTLVAALRPFPEAAKVVSAALHRLESDAAADITAAAGKPAPRTIEHVPTSPISQPLPPPPC